MSECRWLRQDGVQPQRARLAGHVIEAALLQCWCTQQGVDTSAVRVDFAQLAQQPQITHGPGIGARDPFEHRTTYLGLAALRPEVGSGHGFRAVEASVGMAVRFRGDILGA